MSKSCRNRNEHVVANELSTDTKRCACCFRIVLWLFTFYWIELWIWMKVVKKLYVFNAMSLQVTLNVVRYHKRLLLLCNGRRFHTSIYKTFPRGAPKPDPSLKHQSTGDKFRQSGVPIRSSKPKWISKLCSLSRSEVRYWYTKFVFTRMPKPNLVRITSNTTMLTRILIHVRLIFPRFDMVFDPK